jgi:cytochrome c55X
LSLGRRFIERCGARLAIAAALLAPAAACAQAATGAAGIPAAPPPVAATAPTASGTPSASGTPAAATGAAAEPSVALGRRAYTSYCARCHGLNLVVSSSAFYDLRTFPKHDKERFTRSVLKGARAMPAWEGTIKPEELESIWLFIGSVNGW